MENKGAREYAEALFILACEEKREKEYSDELKLINTIFLKNPEYVSLISSPNIKKEEKLDLLKSAFSAHLSDRVMSFLLLLCKKRRIGDFSLCADEFERLYREGCKILVAQVTASVELTKKEKEKIRELLKKKWNRDIELVCKTDKRILGGVIIKVGDTVIDGSIRTRLRNVKEVIR